MSDEKQIKNFRLEILGDAQARVLRTMEMIDHQIVLVRELGIINQNEWSGPSEQRGPLRASTE